MTSIVLIIPYFGELPNLFPLWLMSAGYNPTVRFLLFTDDESDYNYPDNVTVVQMTFEECQKLAQSKYDFPLALSKPYKLCDFKPAYGVIFEEYIRPYDFWGFCDVDLIFGNIRSFVTEELLQKYNRLFFHGHFALTRNNEECNRVYERKVEGCDFYKDVFSTKDNLYFDEYIMGHASTQIWESEYPDLCYKEQPYDDIYAPLWKGNNVNFKTARHSGTFDFLHFRYFRGSAFRIYFKGFNQIVEETMYIHLQKRNIDYHAVLDDFVLVPNKLVLQHTSTSKFLLMWYCRPRYFQKWYGNLYHELQLKWHRFQNKIGK